jgi:hypothetical protein
MEPIQLSDAAKDVLRCVDAQPNAALGSMGSPDLLRDLVDRQILLLRE